MKAICLENTGKNIAEKRVSMRGDSRGANYPVEINREYEIYGVLVDAHGLGKFLICDEASEPEWIPSELFRISDSTVRKDWHVSIDLDAYIPTKIGYSRLVNEIDHFEGIIEGNEDDLIFFFKTKETWRAEG